MKAEKEIKLSGTPLKALVRAAETPVLGHAIKQRLLQEMGLNDLFDLDLRDLDDPALSPTMPGVDQL